MRRVLTSTKQPVDPGAHGIITSDELTRLGREVDFSISKHDTVRAAHGTQVHATDLLLCHKVDD